MRLSPLLHAVPEKQLHRGLNLLWQKVKSSGQVICILLVSVFCSILSQKSSCLVCIGWFKSIVAHNEKLLQGYLPSVYTSVPAVEHHSKAPSWSFVLRKAKYTLPNVLWEGEPCLPVWPRGFPHCGLCDPYPLCSFPLIPSPWLCFTKRVPSPLRSMAFIPQFMAPNLASATISPSNCADCFNLQIIFLVVKK